MKAIIDLGTNTFNLLIGEVVDSRVNIIYGTKLPVLLGMGGINSGKISMEALGRAQGALKVFKEACDSRNVVEIIGYGTSALRDAGNADELIDFANALGINVEIISGQREAELIYAGVKLVHEFTEQAVIMDIGGGSTEFIFASRQGVTSMNSLDIGVSRVYQELGKPEDYSPDQIEYTIRFFEQYNHFFSGKKSDVLIGASGSFESLFEMIFEKEFPMNEGIQELPIEILKPLLDWSINSTLEERMQHEWIVPIRKRMLPIAAIQLKWILDLLEVKKVLISPYALKEGALV